MADTKQKLDLDILLPEPQEVKLGGKYHKVYPPKLKQFIKLLKLFGKFQTLSKETDEVSATEKFDALAKEMEDALDPIMPALKEENLDPTVQQLTKLIEFVMMMSSDMDRVALEAEGIKVTEKKTPEAPESSRGSPTSSENTKATP